MHSILVVTVNYRVGPLCVQALESIAEQIAGRPGCRVVIVDNASHDGSAELIEAMIRSRGWQSWASLLRSPVNGGFAAGNNLAIRPALAGSDPPQYIHLLNPDTIVRPGAIETLWNFMEAHKDVGIAGSRLENVDGTQQHSRFRFPNFWNEVDSVLRLGMVSRMLHRHVITPPLAPVTEQVDWLAGASMMIRREVLDQIGLLDEEYFMYFEETDFSLQARKAGWTCWYVNESRVVHLVGRSSSVDLSRNAARRLPPYWYRSRRRFWVKNHGFLFALFLDAVALTCDGVYRARRFLQRRPTQRPQYWATDLLRMGFSRGARGPLPAPPPGD